MAQLDSFQSSPVIASGTFAAWANFQSTWRVWVTLEPLGIASVLSAKLNFMLTQIP